MSVFDADSPPILQVNDFAGQYTWYDDGWLGRLELAEDTGEAQLRGSYFSYRFQTEHVVTADFGGEWPHEIRVRIHDFNGLDAQEFTGYLSPARRNAIAGVTYWRQERYAFFAKKSAPRLLPAFRRGEAEPGDFAGTFAARCDGGPATVVLEHLDGRRLSGTWAQPGGGSHDVTGEVDADDPLLVRLAIDAPGGPATFTGSLFSRPKNAVAGWIDTPRTRIGCSLVRHS
ncbi:hypothetical protein Aph01nite_45980 [Acrocarpospora phusangensis]|uniref:Uncharacterized protein n=1 Tax=Acrocarpospora phusangensis TaxID=1070424 RepID=A0A919QCQ2_9ACTN|nr:hypothetical protein [Acrocarpospora phusangensis]GIH26288.1 hypothetical protein Aph01nite_45980 [Acrocarpospora phusangensis]